MNTAVASTVGEADYVIVGGGSAGCVLAARLSENPKVKVILLEAGAPSQSFFHRMPVGAFPMMGKPPNEWSCSGIQTEQWLGAPVC